MKICSPDSNTPDHSCRALTRKCWSRCLGLVVCLTLSAAFVPEAHADIISSIITCAVEQDCQEAQDDYIEVTQGAQATAFDFAGNINGMTGGCAYGVVQCSQDLGQEVVDELAPILKSALNSAAAAKLQQIGKLWKIWANYRTVQFIMGTIQMDTTTQNSVVLTKYTHTM